MTGRSGSTAARVVPGRLPMVAIALVAASCGAPQASSTSTSPAAAAASSGRVDVETVAFSLTLPGGVALSMDEGGRILRDGLLLAVLQPDGRLVDANGRSIATLLPDGQIAHRGELTHACILEAMPSLLGGSPETILRDGPADVVTLTGAHLRIAARAGSPATQIEIALAPEAADGARVAVVLAVAVELLERGAR